MDKSSAFWVIVVVADILASILYTLAKVRIAPVQILQEGSEGGRFAS